MRRRLDTSAASIFVKRRSQAVAIRRSASVTLYFLLFMGLTVPTMFMTINVWRIAEGKVQQQRFCDASAHAAGCELTIETTAAPIYSMLLYGDPTDIQNLCQTFCINEAKAFAAMNYVDGVALALDTATVNMDVKFGSFDFASATPAFTLIDPTSAITPASTLEKRNINAVRVEGLRTAARKNSISLFGPAWTGFTDAQVVTRTTAALDRRVVGFRIQNNMATVAAPLGYQNIPLAPVALLSESTAPPVNIATWQYQVERNADPANGAISPIAYGTMTVNVPISGYTAPPTQNARLLDIGIATAAELSSQLTGGITSTQITAYNPTTKDIILSTATFTVDVPEYPAPVSGSGDFTAILTAFQTLQANGTERAWPLYETVSGGDVVVTGFVAARVTNVVLAKDNGGTGNDFIQLTLQPTLMETPTAFTDYSNVFLKGTSAYTAYSRIVNPYICRVRLVD